MNSAKDAQKRETVFRPMFKRLSAEASGRRASARLTTHGTKAPPTTITSEVLLAAIDAYKRAIAFQEYDEEQYLMRDTF